MIPFKPMTFEGPILAASWAFLLIAFYLILKKTIMVPIKRKFGWFFLLFFCSTMFGGRLWGFLIQYNKPFGIQYIIDFLDPAVPGLVSWGMILGGTLGLLIGARLWFFNNNPDWLIDLSRFTDLAAPYIAFFVFFMRIGCFLEGHVLGKESAVMWAIQYPNEIFGRHPVAAYMALSALGIVFLLKIFFGSENSRIALRRKRFEGEPSLWFIIIYTLSIFLIDFLVQGHNWNAETRYFGLMTGQWVAAIIFLGVLTYLISIYLKIYKNEQHHPKAV